MKTLLYKLLIITPLLLLALCSSAQEKTYRIMFYNAENLFDPEDDSLCNDEEFTPDGVRHWTTYKMYEKLHKLAKVVLAVGEWNPPVLVGLCEIENRNVLNKLVYQTALKKFSYRIIHEDSPDKRGIDVALIYRPGLFEPIAYQYHRVKFGEGQRPTRDILVAGGRLPEGDTIFYIVNHWPSRYGGMLKTRSKRAKAAETLTFIVDSLEKKYHRPNIVISGDFNDAPEDESIHSILKARDQKDSTASLFNLSANWLKEGKGTLKHRNAWNVFDQVIISKNLISRDNSIRIKNREAHVFRADFLTEEDKNYQGKKPFRTFVGYKFNGGFSDHYPVWADLIVTDR